MIAFAACGRIGFDGHAPNVGDDDGPTHDAFVADDGNGRSLDAMLDGVCGTTTGSAASCTCADDCTRTCPSGNCDMACTGQSNCTLSCDGGGCTFDCSESVCCEVSCAGGNCTFVASSSATIDGTCSAGCTGECTGISDCTVACGSGTPPKNCTCSGPGCD